MLSALYKEVYLRLEELLAELCSLPRDDDYVISVWYELSNEAISGHVEIWKASEGIPESVLGKPLLTHYQIPKTWRYFKFEHADPGMFDWNGSYWAGLDAWRDWSAVPGEDFALHIPDGVVIDAEILADEGRVPTWS